MSDFKPYMVLRRDWLIDQLIKPLRRARPLPETEDFTFVAGVNGVEINLKPRSQTEQRAIRFGVSLNFDGEDFLGTATVSQGNLIVPKDTDAGLNLANPTLHEPHPWPTDFFPATVTNVTTDCVIALECTWTAHRAVSVSNHAALDTAAHERFLTSWELTQVAIVAVPSADFESSSNVPEPIYDWAADAATTFVELATVTEDPETIDLPVLEQHVYHDLAITHPLQLDLTTKFAEAFPPGSDDGPNNLQPIVFGPGGTQKFEFIGEVGQQAHGYCSQMTKRPMEVTLTKTIMYTNTGQSEAFHELEFNLDSVKNVDTFQPCEDPLM